jgi:uncharacterized protein (TIGR02001 family)
MNRSLLSAALAALLAAPAAAQLTVTANAGAASTYVWRGLTFTNRPVAQGDLSLALPLAGGTLSGGAFANAEAGAYAGAQHFSMNAHDAAGITEVDVWAEYGRALGPASLAAGVVAYRFPNANGFTDAFNTTEVYARATWSSALSPTVSVYQDVGKVNGTYAEASVTHPVALTRGLTLTLGALAGTSRGMSPDEGSDDNPVFGADGATHADLWVTAPFRAGRLTIAPTAHLVLARDVATRYTAPTERHDAKAWFGAKVTWGRALGRAPAN